MIHRIWVFAAALAGFVLAVLLSVWVYRAVDARSQLPLEPWHGMRPAAEFHARDYPDGIDFPAYQALERQLAAELDEQIFRTTDHSAQNALNRYNDSGLVYPGSDGNRWNWSFHWPGKPGRGAVLLIHGASDSPYSLRALAQRFNEAGLQVLALRLPGNGTVPGGLSDIALEDWIAITRMGVETLAESGDAATPLYVVGYSIGAALVLDYTLTALEDTTLRVPDGLFLYSPAIAVSPFARFASWDLALSKIPAFNQFAWVSIQPEYDPYKFNSFPKSAGDVSWHLTRSVESAIRRQSAADGWSRMPPVIAFQSVVDATVSPGALVDIVFEHLPENGSELVLFDINRRDLLQHLLEDPNATIIDRLLHGPARQFAVSLVGNRSPASLDLQVTTRAAGADELQRKDLDLAWPDGVFSLSHVSLPFAPDDPWYGLPQAGAATGAPVESQLALASIAPRGEKDVLRADLGNLMRLRHNPFFSYLAERTLRFCTDCQTAPEPAEKTGESR